MKTSGTHGVNLFINNIHDLTTALIREWNVDPNNYNQHYVNSKERRTHSVLNKTAIHTHLQKIPQENNTDNIKVKKT